MMISPELEDPFARDGEACASKLDFPSLTRSESLDAEILRILCEGIEDSGRSTSASSLSDGGLSGDSDSSLPMKSKVQAIDSGHVRVIIERRRPSPLIHAAPSSSRRGVISRKNSSPVVVPAPPVAPVQVFNDKACCLKCCTGDTPQWRYIHTGRYCNACYMRVKRWVDNNLPGRKLPSRVKADLSPEEDKRLATEAADIVSLAFASLEQSKSS